MDVQQESEWDEAQNIVIRDDLVAAAKCQLQFLAAVDRNRWLYEGPAMHWAIYRYNACWLPLLAKHSESQVTEGPLVVPLDCEWVWHCHRLNPVRYKSDCEEFYGRVLDNHNVVSSVQGTSRRETKEIWNEMYPQEPYDFDLPRALSNDFPEKVYGAERFTKYNLALAIERQSPFFYQVSRSHVNNDLFLQAAVARYKGFLHIIRRNRERSIKRFCVPTYDIDLIWHTHQLHPSSYCKDLVGLMGKILEHDDTDQDRGKGKKLDVGFSETTKQWEDTFGSRYWRAGAMYRGSAPSPVTTTPFTSNVTTKKVDSTDGLQKIIDIPQTEVIEVMLQFVEIKNLPDNHKGRVQVLFSKAQPDGIFDVKRKLNVQPESGQKQVALFQCQPTGYLFFELVSESSSKLPLSRHAKTLGSSFISMEEFFGPESKLSVEKWLDLVPSSNAVSSEPIRLRVAASCTVPSPAPRVLQMVHTRPFSRSYCFFPLPSKVQYAKSWTRVTDDVGNELMSLQMRDFQKIKGIDQNSKRKEVIGVTKAGVTLNLGQFMGTEWSLMDSLWSLKLQNGNDKDAHLLLSGPRMVKLIPGRKLDFEPKHCEKRTNEHDFMTAVEFCAEYPYGRAVAFLGLKSGVSMLQEEWFALPGIISGFIVSNTLRKEGANGLIYDDNNFKERDSMAQELSDYHGAQKTYLASPLDKNVSSDKGYLNAEATMGVPGACGGCGSGCGNRLSSSGYGGGCGGGCGNMAKSGGCGGCGGGGCGGGCGNMVKSGGCGGCGGGCGKMVKSGGCGGCGGGSCGGCGGGLGKQVAVQANGVSVA